MSERTHGRLRLGAGTLYGALNSLEGRGWIRRCGGGGRRHEYVITPDGLSAVRRELDRLREAARTAEEILGEAECDGKAQILRPDAEASGEVAQQNGVPGLAPG